MGMDVVRVFVGDGDVWGFSEQWGTGLAVL